jgi:alpha-L-fucosidase
VGTPDWLSHDLWRSHVSWLTPSWVGSTPDGRKDFDAKKWIDQIHSAHYQTLIFYIKHHDGFTAYPSKLSKAQPERDFFGECVAEVRKRGMRIVAYYSSVLDQITGKEHPEWRVMNREGKPASGWYDPYWPGCYCCINNPGYRGFVLGQLAELRDNYNPDGFWLDVFSSHNDENCFCEFCRDKYRKETGGELRETKGEAWYDTCFADFMGEIRTLIKEKNPDCVLGQNTGIRIPGVEDHVDFLTHEAVDSPTISLMCRGMRSLGKPYESTYRLYSAVGSWSMKGWDRILLEAGAALAHGGACCLELPPLHTGRIMDEPVERLKELGKFVRAIEPYVVNTKGVYDAAIFDPEAMFGWNNRRNPGWHSVLMERDIPFNIVYPKAEISEYQLIIIDDKITVDEKLADRLKEYVRGGGNLIVEAGAAQFGTPTGEILSEILGLTSQGLTGQPAQYLSELDNRLKTDMGEDELIVEGEACKVKVTTAKPLAFLRYEFSPRSPDKNIMINLPPAKFRSNDPAITVNLFGQGRAMYIACPLTVNELKGHKSRWDDAREFPMQLAENLARFMLNTPLLAGNTPAGVEVVINAHKNLHIVHLLNNYMTGQYIDNRRGILKLANVPLTLNEQRIGKVNKAFLFDYTANHKIELPLRRNGSWVEVIIPELSAYEIVVLEH